MVISSLTLQLSKYKLELVDAGQKLSQQLPLREGDEFQVHHRESGFQLRGVCWKAQLEKALLDHETLSVRLRAGGTELEVPLAVIPIKNVGEVGKSDTVLAVTRNYRYFEVSNISAARFCELLRQAGAFYFRALAGGWLSELAPGQVKQLAGELVHTFHDFSYPISIWKLPEKEFAKNYPRRSTNNGWHEVKEYLSALAETLLPAVIAGTATEATALKEVQEELSQLFLIQKLSIIGYLRWWIDIAASR